MVNSLADWYHRTQLSTSLEASLPKDVGNGHISRISTPQGVCLSEWKMRYHRDTPVKGDVGDELRLLFCLGEGVEWRTAKGDTLCVKASQGCLCVGDGTTESMRYASDLDYAFRQISMTRVRAEQILKPFIPESVIERLPQELNGRAFAITGNMRRLLNGFDRAGSIDNGLEMMRLECHARELLALCMEQALGIAGDAGLHPDDLAAVRAVRKRIDADAASVPDIAALAKEYAVSPSKLSRDFKQAYGMSIHACVIEARLDEAARLLSSGHMSVGAVAEQVGYAKHSQFSEAFRRRFGVLPKDY